jgi:RNA polymerase sigma-70 factor (ECF subfamily)
VQRALVERARDGDHEAFGALAAATADHLFAVATLILRDRSAAEDAVQETLTRVWRDLPKLRDVDRFGPWLQRILTRACYDEARVRRRRGPEISLLAAHEPVVLDHTVPIAERDALNRGFRRLSVEHRTALVLRHYVGLPVPDLATAMGIPLGTAKSRLHHAERALRASLEADARVGGGERSGGTP